MKQNEWDLRNLIAEGVFSHKRLLMLLIGGLAAGILTTAFGSAGYTFFSYAIGEVGSGLFLWAVVCTLIAVSAKSPLHAAGGVVCYLVSMLLGCVLAGRLGGCYVWEALLLVRMLALIPAGLLGLCAWYLRRSEPLRIAALAAGIVLLMFDIVFISDATLPVLATEGGLFFAFFTVLRHLGEDQREQILYRRNFMGSCEPLNRF